MVKKLKKNIKVFDKLTTLEFIFILFSNISPNKIKIKVEINKEDFTDFELEKDYYLKNLTDLKTEETDESIKITL